MSYRRRNLVSLPTAEGTLRADALTSADPARRRVRCRPRGPSGVTSSLAPAWSCNPWDQGPRGVSQDAAVRMTRPPRRAASTQAASESPPGVDPTRGKEFLALGLTRREVVGGDGRRFRVEEPLHASPLSSFGVPGQ